MFDMFRDNDEVVAAILTHVDVMKNDGMEDEEKLIDTWFEYLELIRKKRREHIAELKERYDEIL